MKSITWWFQEDVSLNPSHQYKFLDKQTQNQRYPDVMEYQLALTIKCKNLNKTFQFTLNQPSKCLEFKATLAYQVHKSFVYREDFISHLYYQQI